MIVLRTQPFAGHVVLLLACLLVIGAGEKPKKRKKAAPTTPPPSELESEYIMINVEPIDTVRDFKEKVEQITNNTDYETTEGGPAYYPVVFFHVSWCEHCKAAKPELDHAAGKILDGAEGNPALTKPKFFSVQCDKVSKAISKLCDKFVGTNFPSLYVYRENRQYRFWNRPRTKEVYRWWMGQVLRPELLGVSNKKEIQRWKTPIFVLKASENQKEEIAVWSRLARPQIYMEEITFAVIDAKSPGAKDFSEDVYTWAPKDFSLDPIVYTGDITGEDAEEQLKAWVDVSRFPAINEITEPFQLHNLRQSGRRVVMFVSGGGKSSREARKAFQSFVLHTRPTFKFLFGVVNVSNQPELEGIQQRFPLLAPSVCSYPKVFGIEGDAYYEDPTFSDMSKVTVESLEEMFESSEARQGPGWMDWCKEKRKIYIRFATKSVANGVLALAMPMLLLAILHIIGKTVMGALFTSDDADGKAIEKAEKKKD